MNINSFQWTIRIHDTQVYLTVLAKQTAGILANTLACRIKSSFRTIIKELKQLKRNLSVVHIILWSQLHISLSL